MTETAVPGRAGVAGPAGSVAPGPDEPRWLAAAVTLVILGVGFYDVAIGAWMLWLDAPETAHGEGTVWLSLRPILNSGGPAAQGVEAALRRIGAYSLHAGVVTCVWGALAWRRPPLRSVLFATYLVTGMAFFTTDQRFFADTPYRAMKEWIGYAFTGALCLHFAGRYGAWRRARTPPRTS